MTVTSMTSENVVTLKVSGRLDTETSSQFREEMKKIPQNAEKLVFDFTDVSYVSSAGLSSCSQRRAAVLNNGFQTLLKSSSKKN